MSNSNQTKNIENEKTTEVAVAPADLAALATPVTHDLQQRCTPLRDTVVLAKSKPGRQSVKARRMEVSCPFFMV